MEWTKETPAVEGWYVYWQERWGSPKLVKVYSPEFLPPYGGANVGNKLVATLPVTCMPYSYSGGYPLLSMLLGYWCGPLDIPAELPMSAKGKASNT